MNFLENDVLEIKSKFIPLQSSSTQSTSAGEGSTDEGGAPEKDVGDLTDSGEQSREDGDDWWRLTSSMCLMRMQKTNF